MPIFELGDFSTQDGRWWTMVRVHAAMLFPDDPAARSRLLATMSAATLDAKIVTTAAPPDHPGGCDPLPVIAVDRASSKARLEWYGGYQTLVDAPRWGDFRDLSMRSRSDWYMAGGVLWMLLRLAIEPEFRDQASINRAAFVLEQRPLVPGVMKANRKDIIEAWSRYKPVAHFCATHLDLTLNAAGMYETIAGRQWFLEEVQLNRAHEFIQSAWIFQSFGLTHQLPRSRGQTPLDPATLHRLPLRDLRLDEFSVRPAHPALLDVARRYRAPKRLD